MNCPRCENVLLFPDWDESTERDRTRRHLCAICGWTQELDKDGQPYQPPVMEEEPFDADWTLHKHNASKGVSLPSIVQLNKAKVGRDSYDGCDVAPSCFACPLADCKDMDPEGYRRWKRDVKYGPVLEKYGGKPLTSKQLGEVTAALGVGPRAVWRYLAQVRREE